MEEFKETECKGCRTKKRPLFMRTPPRDNKDIWCKPCMDAKKHLD